MSRTPTCGVAVLCAAMHQTPVLPSLAAARQEAEMVMFESVEQVLSDHKVSPKQV